MVDHVLDKVGQHGAGVSTGMEMHHVVGAAQLEQRLGLEWNKASGRQPVSYWGGELEQWDPGSLGEVGTDSTGLLRGGGAA